MKNSLGDYLISLLFHKNYFEMFNGNFPIFFYFIKLLSIDIL